MKRLPSLIAGVALLLGCGFAYASSPMIQHFNNGESELYNTNDVDSISFSHYDTDSLWHEDIVSQIIWSNGNPYISMIAEIDSVTLYRPAIKTLPDVREITYEIRSYIKSVDFQNFQWFIDPASDSYKEFSVGDIFYTLEMDRTFPCGFMGEVTKIETADTLSIVKFNPLDYEDVFESYYGSFSSELISQDTIAKVETKAVPSSFLKAQANDNVFFQRSVPTFHYQTHLDYLTPIMGFEFENTNNQIDVRLTPSINIRNDIAVINGKKLRSTKVDAIINLTGSASFSGNIYKEIKLPAITIDRPIPVAPMICLYAEAGPLINLSIENATVSAEFTRSFSIHSGTNFSTSSASTPHLEYEMSEITWNPDKTYICGDGTVNVGGYIELGIESIAEALRKRADSDFNLSLGSLSMGFSGGYSIGAKAKFTESDWQNSTKNTNLYHALTQPDNISVGLFGQVYAEASALNMTYNTTLQLPIAPAFRKPFLPKFTDVVLDTSNGYCINAKAPYKAGFCAPTLAFVAYDINDVAHYNIYSAGKANTNDDVAVGVFEYPAPDHTYRYQPYMQVGKKLILAEPVEEYDNTMGSWGAEVLDYVN